MASDVGTGVERRSEEVGRRAPASTVWSSAARLLRESDTALHQAKAAGHEHHVFAQAMQSRATMHLAIERDLARALEDGELVVHYQPLVDLSEAASAGAEALVRWQHPERGLVPPDDFIGVAEQTGRSPRSASTSCGGRGSRPRPGPPAAPASSCR